MTDTKQSQDERVQPRSEVDLSVQWSDGHRVRKGMIRDASVSGLFLSPSWEPTDPIAPGDVITMRIAGHDKATEVEAIVRWVGASTQHECHGIGMSTSPDNDLSDFIDETEDE